MSSAALAKSPSVLVGLVRAADAGAILACGLLAFLARHGVDEVPGRYWLAILAAAVLASQLFQAARLYAFPALDHVTPQVTRLAAAWGAVALTLLAVIFFAKRGEEFSRLWALAWFGSSFLAFIAIRVFVRFRLARWRAEGLLNRTVAVVGAGEPGRRLIAHLNARPQSGVRLIGLFDDRRTRIQQGDVEGVPVRGTVDDLLRLSRSEGVDLVIVALPWSADARLLEILARLRQAPLDVQLAPDSIGYRLFERRFESLGGAPMLNVFERPLSGWSRVLKAVEDRTLAALLLLLAAPIMIAVAIAVRLDSPGPALFRQRRWGFNNNEIVVRKFRTMRLDADGAAADQAPHARRGDARVTRVGAFLRRTSLDELPQLLNVLEGSMSLVGPRPHAVAHNERYAREIDQYYARHRVKPGITGWAQVHGLRGETDTPDKMAKRVEYDLYYIDNWSLLLDLRILLMTLAVGLVHRNAY